MCTKHMKATEEYNSIRLNCESCHKRILSYHHQNDLVIHSPIFCPFFYISLFSPSASLFDCWNLKIDLYNAVRITHKTICKVVIYTQINDFYTYDIKFILQKSYTVFFHVVQCHECSKSNNQCIFIFGHHRGVLSLSMALLLWLWIFPNHNNSNQFTHSAQCMHFISRYCFQESLQSIQLRKRLNERMNK